MRLTDERRHELIHLVEESMRSQIPFHEGHAALLELENAIMSAPSEVVADQWCYDMDAAPKDGTPIRLQLPTPGVEAIWGTDLWTGDPGWIDPEDGLSWAKEPKAWMPAPPSTVGTTPVEKTVGEHCTTCTLNEVFDGICINCGTWYKPKPQKGRAPDEGNGGPGVPAMIPASPLNSGGAVVTTEEAS